MTAIWKDTLSYACHGEGKPLVILHALGTDHRAMEAWMEPLFANRPGWLRIYIDLPAHGHSQVKNGGRTSEDMLAIILEFLDDFIPGKRFALAGKSFGGYIAQGIFARKKALLDGFFLLSPALHLQERTLPARTIVERDEMMLQELAPDIRAAFETLMTVQTRENLAYFLEEVQPGRLLADRDFLTSDWRTKGYFFPFSPFDDMEPLRYFFSVGRMPFAATVIIGLCLSAFRTPLFRFSTVPAICWKSKSASWFSRFAPTGSIA
ncbi:alpha/beta fold hydrolase [Brevibacillus borstelensis]|uniref:alpha/beta fold hydrolase n=1 Tax=Brevibacillus borstelensis TaxID=45462 RepID=UPI0030EE7684